MADNSFALPIDVPWYLVAASPDMMATSFCTDPTATSEPTDPKATSEPYPPAWHSSMAIYAYEPSPDDLPAEMCDQKITYLKVACSITGFQPTAEESNTLAGPPYNFSSPYTNPAPFELAFPNTPGGGPDIDPTTADPAPDFGDFLNPYFACYGVLLNVKVVPSVTTVPQATPSGSNTITITSTDNSFPNPFNAAPDGTTFTLLAAGPLASIPIGPVAGTRQRGILLASGQTLEIALPLSTNITLAMYAPAKGVIGTVTAYEFETQTYSGPLTASQSAGGVTQFPIPKASATKLVISPSVANSYFVSVSYASLERPTTLSDYPHIIDFEPKTRDLYQTATDQSELLTGSSGSINTGKSLTNTSSSQMGLGLAASISGSYGGVNFGGSGSLTSSWGNSTSDTSNTQIDQSRETRETQGSTTNITQQYNLLTGYHAGTNRAAFLMLPRPHTLQATDYRTFIRGLRMIEGVQEFFLIVSRPIELPGLCIEATLETGHFPETVSTLTPQAPPGPTTVKDAPAVPINVPGSGGAGTSPTATPFTVSIASPWIIDTSQSTLPAWPLPISADPTVPWTFLAPGLFYTYGPLSGDNTTSVAYKQAKAYFLIGLSGTTDTGATGTIWVTPGGFMSWGNSGGTNATMQVWIAMCGTQPAQQVPPPVDNEPVVVSPFLVTSRDLCVCINSCTQDNCVMIAPTQQVPYGQSPGPVIDSSSPGGTSLGVSAAALPATVRLPTAAGQTKESVKRARLRKTVLARRVAPPPAPRMHGKPGQSSIVYESKIKISPNLLKPEHLQKSRTPAARELMYQVQHHMLNSWRLPPRRPHHSVGFLDSDFLAERLMKCLSPKYLSCPVAKVKGLAGEVVKKLGGTTTVGSVLALNLYRLRLRAKVSLEEAVAIRRTLLGLPELNAWDKSPSEKAASGTAPERHRKGPASVKKITGTSRSREKTRRPGKRRT
jgi:hypothetical protein